MQITVSAAPRFSLPLSRAQVLLLSQLSFTHYDFECRAAGVPGINGFIHGWGNRLDFAREAGQPVPAVDATWSQLDLSLKILENTMGLSKANLAFAEHLTRNIRGALAFSREQAATWTAVYSGEP
jgi:hypothetical protein